MKSRTCFIGRFSPFHKGHLNMMLPYKNEPICVLVMESKHESDVDAVTRARWVDHRLRKLGFKDILVAWIPLCHKYIIGRDVGYEIIKAEETPEVSGTKIREWLA